MFSKGSKSGSNSGGSSSGQSSNPPYPQWIFKILWVSAAISLGAIAFANIRPYVNLMRHMGLHFIDKFLLHVLAAIPIVNALFAAGGSLVSLVAGTALWAVFQIIEVLPVILYNHSGFLEEVISDAESGRKYATKCSDLQC